MGMLEAVQNLMNVLTNGEHVTASNEAHAHTNAACSAVIPMLCHLYLVSLSSLLGSLSFSLLPHIHLTILISAR